jgi:DNA end-binding protein Ku
MARTLRRGARNFGLVNIPVCLDPAIREIAIHFNEPESGTSGCIRYAEVDQRAGDEVDWRGIVNGVGLGGGEYVIPGDDETAAGEPVRFRLIEITDFVDLGKFEPVSFRDTYHLTPEVTLLARPVRSCDRRGGTRPGRLRRPFMRYQEHPVVIRTGRHDLALETMYFADAVRPLSDDLPDLPCARTIGERERSMAHLRVDGDRA